MHYGVPTILGSGELFIRQSEIHVAVLGTTFRHNVLFLLLLLLCHLPRDVSKFFYNFASRSPILAALAYLKNVAAKTKLLSCCLAVA